MSHKTYIGTRRQVEEKASKKQYYDAKNKQWKGNRGNYK